MNLFFTLFPFYLVVLLLIQLVPVRINLFFVRENKNDFMTIRVNTFFSLIRFNVEIPVFEQETPFDLTMEAEFKAGQDELLREEEKKLSVLDIDWDKVRQYVEYFRKNRRMLWFIFRFYIRAMTVEKLMLRIRAGMDDAALTGLVTGFYWTVTGLFSAMAQQWLRLKEQPVFTISPDFSPEPVFAAKFDSVVSFRIGHFTLGGLLFLVTKIRGGNE